MTEGHGETEAKTTEAADGTACHCEERVSATKQSYSQCEIASLSARNDGAGSARNDGQAAARNDAADRAVCHCEERVSATKQSYSQCEIASLSARNDGQAATRNDAADRAVCHCEERVSATKQSYSQCEIASLSARNDGTGSARNDGQAAARNDAAGDSAGAGFTLPAWRLFEVMGVAVRALCEGRYYDAGFDYKKMITDQGIALRGYSVFQPENLQKMRMLSTSFWSEGLCLSIPAGDDGMSVKMICYNDRCEHGEEMMIILHEYGHLCLRHTEQSVNGEAEAICFAATAALLIAIEGRFHLAQRLARAGAIESLSQMLANGNALEQGGEAPMG